MHTTQVKLTDTMLGERSQTQGVKLKKRQTQSVTTHVRGVERGWGGTGGSHKGMNLVGGLGMYCLDPGCGSFQGFLKP